MLIPSDILLNWRVAVITGGAAGIRRDIATNFAHFGADVVIADKDGERGEVTARDIRASGHQALSMQTDVTQ